MTGFLAAFRFTFLRCLREPALAVVLGAAMILLFLAPAGTALGFHEEEALIRDIGLSTMLLAGILIALVTAGAGDRRGGATQLLSLRPAGGAAFHAGACAGALLAALAANLVVACNAFVLLRHRPLVAAARDDSEDPSPDE